MAHSPGPQQSSLVRRRGLIALLLIAGAGIGWYAFTRLDSSAGASHEKGTKPPPGVTVEVIQPLAGGIRRTCVQPGTLEPLQSSDLYAKVSGYLVEQHVDIGSRVKKGEVLARIAVPELEKQVEKEAAELKRADARLVQMTAAIATSEAELLAATATLALSEAELKSKMSIRAYHQKQLDRIKELAAQNAVDARLEDEHRLQVESAMSVELAAREGINAARQKEAAARAKVEQAKADQAFAEADVRVSRAQHEKSEELFRYTTITSPFDGVVTRRNFHPGGEGRPAAFIRSAESNGEKPLLTVERTDIMRVVIHVPDRDVPFVNPGDEATVEIDALPGEVYKSQGENRIVISRSAESEDPHTRTMRTEVDLPNADGRLRRGMYGQVVLDLQRAATNAVRIPSKALYGKTEGGRGSVRVVRGDHVHLVPIRFGIDDGREVEILSGITTEDRVVTRASGPVNEDEPVTVIAASKSSGH